MARANGGIDVDDDGAGRVNGRNNNGGDNNNGRRIVAEAVIIGQWQIVVIVMTME